MRKRINSKAALLVGGAMAALATSSQAAGISDVATELATHATAILGLGTVALGITGAYIVIHHIKKGARSAGS